MRVEFREEGHVYTLIHENVMGESVREEILPSVTQILKSAGLIDTSKYAPGSAERGTAIHELTEVADREPENNFDYDGIDPAWFPYLMAYKDAVRDYDIEILETEKVVYGFTAGKYFGGKIDRIATYRPWPGAARRKIIIDIKTGAAQKWHPIQLTAYEIAMGDDEPKGEGYDLGALYIDAKGGYKLRLVHDRPGAYSAWVNAVKKFEKKGE